MGLAPRKLSTIPVSPNFNRDACALVDKVFVDGEHVPNCAAYDMDAGWAFSIINGVWQPKKHGTVTVKLKNGG